MGKYSIEDGSIEDWEGLVAKVNRVVDLEESARATKALVRRRAIRSASDLMRLVLCYAMWDWSLKLVGAWSQVLGMGQLSDVAVRQRLVKCERWLGLVVASMLKARQVEIRQQAGVRVKLMDATCVSQPGSVGTDWRLHLTIDLGQMCVEGAELTDFREGEGFGHYPGQAGDIHVADRAYGVASSLACVLEVGGYVVVRINGHNLPLQTPDGQRLDVRALLRSTTDLTEYHVVLVTDPQPFPLRLILAPLPPEAAQLARSRKRQLARKKGKTLSEQTLLAAGFVLLVSNLPSPTWSADQLVTLYRLRWQIELLFKRAKSILHFDALRAQSPALARVYLLAKLLSLLLLEDFMRPVWLRAPRPFSLFRLTRLLFDALSILVRGPISFAHLVHALPSLARFLSDPPRHRSLQLPFAHRFLASFP
jgi:hypothetical protein